jgi:hypothetical protein
MIRVVLYLGGNGGTVGKHKEKCLGSFLEKKTGISEEDDSLNSQGAIASASSFERKISRSRFVGCGSRSFSGDFFERISTSFGDCIGFEDCTQRVLVLCFKHSPHSPPQETIFYIFQYPVRITEYPPVTADYYKSG